MSWHFVWLSYFWFFFQFELWLQERSQSYSNMIQLKSIGKSREGKDIWQVKVCGFCFLICSTCTYGSILITKKKYSVLLKFWLIFHHRLLPTWTMPRSRPCTWSVWPTPENGSRGRCVSAPSTSWVSAWQNQESLLVKLGGIWYCTDRDNCLFLSTVDD